MNKKVIKIATTAFRNNACILKKKVSFPNIVVAIYMEIQINLSLYHKIKLNKNELYTCTKTLLHNFAFTKDFATHRAA